MPVRVLHLDSKLLCPYIYGPKQEQNQPWTFITQKL